MYNCTIITDDDMIYRLISLELNAKGIITSSYSGSISDTDIWVLDLDTAAKSHREISSLSDGRLICFGLKDKSEYKSFSKIKSFFRRPFDIRELAGAVCASVNPAEPLSGISPAGIENIEFNHDAKSVTMFGKTVHLSPNEYRLFSVLYENKGKVVTREKLIDSLSSSDAEFPLNVYIKYLRNKLDGAYRIKLIHTVRGVGYVIKQ